MRFCTVHRFVYPHFSDKTGLFRIAHLAHLLRFKHPALRNISPRVEKYTCLIGGIPINFSIGVVDSLLAPGFFTVQPVLSCAVELG